VIKDLKKYLVVAGKAVLAILSGNLFTGANFVAKIKNLQDLTLSPEK